TPLSASRPTPHPPAPPLSPYTTLFRSDRVCSLLGSGCVPQLSAVSVNLSMQQFMSDDLETHISAALQRYDVPANRLKLEITERRSEEHTSELQSRFDLVCRLLLDKKKH